MDTITTANLAELASTISLTGFLLYAWYKEREDRITAYNRLFDHLEGHEDGKQELTDSVK